MKHIHKILLTVLAVIASTTCVDAQTGTSTATLRRNTGEKNTAAQEAVSNRQKQRTAMPSATDSELGWTRVLYRSLDLTKPKNAPLYYPEPPLGGRQNLFRTVFDLVSSGKVKAFAYLDGREELTDANEMAVKDIMERFRIPFKENNRGGWSTIVVDDADVPSEEVMSYYIIERYEFDRKNTRMRVMVDAICPVLHRTDDWGIDAVKYPMFWVRFDDLRPYLTDGNVFVSDENNIPSCSYDDYFLLGLYDGEIVKTRNALNKSLAELYPDKDALKHAQDSIQQSIDNFGKGLWVPSLEELQTRSGQQTGTTVAKRDTKKQKSLKIKTKRGSAPKASGSSGAATRSVRNRKR